jgi:hypothetical protein
MSWVMYRQIEPIRVICYSLFLFVDNTHSLQLAIEDVHKAGVHVFIYDHTRS